jgi:hypothetical protein
VAVVLQFREWQTRDTRVYGDGGGPAVVHSVAERGNSGCSSGLTHFTVKTRHFDETKLSSHYAAVIQTDLF